MNKNIIIGILLVIIALGAGSTVYASLRTTNEIYDINSDASFVNNKVSTFAHEGNRCYIARSSKVGLNDTDIVSISCVKGR